MTWARFLSGGVNCETCAIQSYRQTLTAYGDQFTEQDLATIERAVAYASKLNEQDGISNADAPTLFEPDFGARCDYCHIRAGAER